MERTVLQGVLLDEALEVVFPRAGHLGRATRARAIHQAVHPLVGKAVDPFAKSGIGKVQRVGDRLEPLPFDHVAYGLGRAEYRSLFRLFGYPLKAGQLTYDCRYSTLHGMPVTGGRGFRGLKPLWDNSVPPSVGTAHLL